MTLPPNIGYHVSSAGGLLAAWKRAKRLGSRAFQVFSSPPRNWSLPKLDPERLEEDLREIQSSGGGPIVFHAPYLVNLASGTDEIRMRSVDSVVFGLELAHLAGGASLVVHAGTAPDGDISTALARLRSSVKKINRLAPKGGRLVFELTSGAGVPIAALPREIPRLFEAVEPFDDIGFCLDTQHLWAAGFDWTTDHAGDLLLEELDGLGLLDALACIHLNDSKSEMGSRLDRHENLGDGKIGIGPLVEFVTNPTLRDIPFILETPGSDAARRRELKRLRRAARVSLRTSARLRAVRGGRSEGSI